MIEHCVSAFLEGQKEKAYKIYITDCLYSLANQYSLSHGAEQVIQKRYADILMDSEKKEEVKEENAEDVINRMREKAKRM